MRPPQWYFSYRLWLNHPYKYIPVYPALLYTYCSIESSTKPGSTAQNESTVQFPRLDCSSPWVISRRRNLLPNLRARTKSRSILPSARDLPWPRPIGRSYGYNHDKIGQDQLKGKSAALQLLQYDMYDIAYTRSTKSFLAWILRQRSR